MPVTSRPMPVGLYELLQDFNSPKASVRVFRIKAEEQAVQAHVHARSAQIYVALQGRVLIEIDGTFKPLEPYAAIYVPMGAEHSARPAGDEEVVVMNISVPPLAADDQAPLGPVPTPPDLNLPDADGDVED